MPLAVRDGAERSERELDGRATRQLVPRYREIGSDAYLYGTSQGPSPEDARKDGHIHGRSRLFMQYPGQGSSGETRLNGLSNVRNLIHLGKDLEMRVHFRSFLPLNLTNIVRE